MNSHRRQLASAIGPTSSRHPLNLNQSRRSVIQDLTRNGSPYSRKLSTHTSCVNALTFSSGDARWLASAGDDHFVLLWDFHQEDLLAPSHRFVGPRANVFSLAFSATSQYLYSGDTDSVILKYDLSRLTSSSSDSSSPVARCTRHDGSIRAISCHPEQEEVFLSASEDGVILLHDGRAKSSPTRGHSKIEQHAEFTGLQYHPTTANLFVTGDAKGGLYLCDARMAFGHFWTHRTRTGVVREYVTGLWKSSTPHLSRPEIGSVTFDRTGSKLAVTMLQYLPTIYALSDPFPLAVCSGRNLPDGSPVPEGDRTYQNACTIKHGSFGGPGSMNDDYYAAGSDDFRTYIWKIPELSELQAARVQISAERWRAEDDTDTIGFTTGHSGDRCIPMELRTPVYRLGGHRSIVNTTLMHPHWPLVVSAGVERHIVLHSATPSSPCARTMALTPTDVRALPDSNREDQRLYVQAMVSGRDMDSEDDADTIALFDEILRQEAAADLFEMRRWSPEPKDSDEDSDEEEEISTESDDI